MGCDCDAGYHGPDCSLRQCKSGIDPLYLDDVSTIKYSIFDVAILSTTTTGPTPLFTNGEYDAKTGYWALRFFDSFGEDWLTAPIPAGASCSVVVAALEALPNNVIPPGQTYCTLTMENIGAAATIPESAFHGIDAQHTGRDHFHQSPGNREYQISYNMSLWEADSAYTAFYWTPIATHQSSYASISTKLAGYIYRLKFYGNPGALAEPEVEIYLDGKRPSLVAPQSATGKVITKVWTDGQQGEDNDYFADHCDGVTVNINAPSTGVAYHFLTGFTTSEKNLLKACLGNSDFDTSNNIDVYNWDHGSIYYPHIIKLVRTVTTYSDGGYYAVVWFDNTAVGAGFDNLNDGTGTFRLLNPINPPDAFYTDNYEVYTTQGTLALTSNRSEATFGFASKSVYMTNVTYDENNEAAFDGDISCEVGANNAYKFKYIFHCLNKGDMFTLLNWEYPTLNPPHINLYTAERLMHTDLLWSNNARFTGSNNKKINNVNMGMHYMTHVITTDYSTNWAAAVQSALNTNQALFRVYKFFPAVASTYQYVAPCSNRGICDTSTGTCTCFPGYTSDSCSEQSSIAI